MTRDILRLTIPGEPVPWARAGRFGGRTFTPRPQAKAKEAIAWLAKAERKGSPFEGPIWAILTYRLPVPKSWSKTDKNAAIGGQIGAIKKPDADNLAKLTLDALKDAGVFKDDCQITTLHVRKKYSAEPSTTIILCEDIDQ